MSIILTELSRVSAPMNTLGRRWNPLQSHSRIGPKKPVPSALGGISRLTFQINGRRCRTRN